MVDRDQGRGVLRRSFVRRVVLPEYRRLPAGIPAAGVFVRSRREYIAYTFLLAEQSVVT